MASDGAGGELTAAEEAIVSAYGTLVGVLRDEGDALPPFEQRNVVKAVAALWHVVDGLDLEPELPYDLGV